MSIEDNKRLVEQRQKMWNEGDIDRVDDLFSEDYVGHFPDEDRRGPESVRTFIDQMRTAFPDARVSYDIVVAEQQLVAVFVRFRGTHRGHFGELEPTGRRVETTASFFSRIDDGQFAEEWLLMDNEGMMAQLNAGPKTPPVGPRFSGDQRGHRSGHT